jgi:hypothetical protein
VAWWNQQVELQQNEELVTAANEAVQAAANPEAKAEEVLKGEGKLAEPLTFKGD